MIGRRWFLAGAGALVTLASLGRFKDHLAAHGAPLVEAPPAPDHALYVHPGSGFLITLDHTVEEDPGLMARLTWREIVWGIRGWADDYTPTRQEWRDVVDEFQMRRRDLGNAWDPDSVPDTINDLIHNLWASRLCPGAQAYTFLSDALEVPLHRRGGVEEHGGIEFVVGTANGEGNEVYLLDDLSMSMLQETLTRSGLNVAVRVIC